MDDTLPPDLASIDEINSYLRFDIQPLTRATEMAAEAVHALQQIDAAAGASPTFSRHLSAVCPDWRASLQSVDDPLQTILGLVRLTRQRVDHLAELTRVDLVAANAAMLDPSAPRH
jgi:hypothetical protein